MDKDDGCKSALLDKAKSMRRNFSKNWGKAIRGGDKKGIIAGVVTIALTILGGIGIIAGSVFAIAVNAKFLFKWVGVPIFLGWVMVYWLSTSKPEEDTGDGVEDPVEEELAIERARETTDDIEGVALHAIQEASGTTSLAFVADRLPSGGAVRPIPIDLSRCPHALIVGPTGSGKSVASMLLTAKIGLHIPNSKAWILDFKGDDNFEFLRRADGARYYQYTECMRGLEEFYTMFQARLSGDPDRSFRLLWVDEWTSLILSLPKKEADEAKSKLAICGLMGRSMGIFLLNSVQQASASLFAQGSGGREQYNICLALSNVGAESAAMLGFDRDEFLPVTSIGGGHLLLNGTEQRPVQVPFIGPRGMERMKADILRVVTR